MSLRIETLPEPLHRCLVTGAGGLIGTALCRRLREQGGEVHGVGRTVPREHAADHWHRCDVSERQSVGELVRRIRPAVVFHLAGRVTGSRNLDLVLPNLFDNLVGTVNLLLAAHEAQAARVLCLGSLQEPDTELQGVPNSPYSASKYSASAYARMFAHVYGLPVTIVRPFMVYGPGQMDFSKLVPYVLSRLLRGEVAELSSGQQAFDWVYVDDVGEALIAAAVTDGMSGLTIDVGTGSLVSVAEIARSLAERLQTPQLLRLGAIPDRKLEPTRVADVQLTEARIGWRARTSITEGLDRALTWYRAYFAAGRPAERSRG